MSSRVPAARAAGMVLAFFLLLQVGCAPKAESGADWRWLSGLKKPDGTAYTRAELTGKPVVLFFFSAWSTPSMPMAEELSIAAQRARVIAVAADPADLSELETKPNLEPALADEQVQEHFGIAVVPTAVVLDVQGRVALRLEGYRPGTGSEALTCVDSLVRAARERR